MKRNYYNSTQKARIGDVVTTGWFGTAKVLTIEKGIAKVENIMTKETAHVYVDDCDYIENTFADLCDAVKKLLPIYNLSGINNHRPITNNELQVLTETCDAIRQKMLSGDATVESLIIFDCEDIIKHMVVVGFGMASEGAKRMLGYRNERKH